MSLDSQKPTQIESMNELGPASPEKEDGTESVADLLERYRPLLRAIIATEIEPVLQSKVDPSDLVQDTLLEVARSSRLKDLTHGRQLWAYMRQILLNKLTDTRRRFLKSLKRNVRLEQTISDTHERLCGVVPDYQMIDKLIDEELYQRTREVVNRLPLEVRKILNMRFQQGLTYREIGEHISRSEDDVRMLMKRCLQRIRNEVQPESSS